MKLKKAALVSGIAAAVLAVSAAAYAQAPWWADRSHDLTAEEIKAATDAMQEAKDAERAANNGLTEFEEAILRGEVPPDPIRALNDPNYKPGEETVYFDVSPASSTLTLQKVHGSEDGSYTLWSGTFTTSDVSKFASSFDDPQSFTCCCDNTTAEITGKLGFYYNYKEVSENLTYLNNGEKKVVTASDHGTAKTLTAAANAGSGELVEATYFYYLYKGTEFQSGLYEVAVVHVVDSSYAESDLYKQNSYADRIGGYPYIDSSVFGADEKK